MFTKINYAFYNALFEFYGKQCEYYLAKAKEDKKHQRKWRRKVEECVAKREDILDIMFVLKGIA